MIRSHLCRITLLGLLTSALCLLLATVASLRPAPLSLQPEFLLNQQGIKKRLLLDSSGEPLFSTLENHLNGNLFPLHSIPDFLTKSFIASEDKRFFSHHGPDWMARIHAFFQNMMAFKVIRGASTISEQVVRILNPRKRNLWSRWLEGFEATRLETQFSKNEILEFYLNQLPFSGRRRGVKEAASAYFGRDLTTLTRKEMLSLVVMARSPSKYNSLLSAGSKREIIHLIEGPLLRLAANLASAALLSPEELALLKEEKLVFKEALPAADVRFFVSYARSRLSKEESGSATPLRTTLDQSLQREVQHILDTALSTASLSSASSAASIVIENRSGNILAWVKSDSGETGRATSEINSPLVERQPGSALKPFLYALVLKKGWTAAHIIDDSPLSRPVGFGLHKYRNYSRSFYGPLRLRDCLGNSLNIPALKAVQFAGVKKFSDLLKDLGITSLKEAPSFYGEGLALGNAEVSLFELVQAYSALARGGSFLPLTAFPGRNGGLERNVFSPEVSYIISDILSDPEARKLEFGRGGVLHFPAKTAVKTGTSSDYHDAFAFAFNSEYTAGVWMGNLDREPMNEISGATGPALALRSIFSTLPHGSDGFSSNLPAGVNKIKICAVTGHIPQSTCPVIRELFVDGTDPAATCAGNHSGTPPSTSLSEPFIVNPSPGLRLALDPRVPRTLQAFRFTASVPSGTKLVRWYVDEKQVAETPSQNYLWNMQRGRHTVKACVITEVDNAECFFTQTVGYVVK